MTIALSFLIRLLIIRWCASLGAKRVIGGFTAVVYGLAFSYLGILFILASRRLDDEQANARLIEKYRMA